MSESTSQSISFQLPKIFADLGRADRDTRVRLANLAGKPFAEQTPEVRQLVADMRAASVEFSKLPLSSIPPEYHRLHRSMVIVQPLAQGLTDEMSPELEEMFRRGESKMINECLSKTPQYVATQIQIDELLQQIEFPIRFNLPAWLNAIAQQLHRPKPFLLLHTHTPTNETLKQHLDVIRTKEPLVHLSLVKLLVGASLLAKDPHPKQCTCLLCSQVASVGFTNSSSSA